MSNPAPLVLSLVSALSTWVFPAPGAPPAAGTIGAAWPGERDDLWREDVLHLVSEMERLHPDLHYAVSREELEEAVDAFDRRIPELSDDELHLELMRLVALPFRGGRDGHSGAWWTRGGIAPLQVHEFADGPFVVAAAAGHERLVGARVLGIGEATWEEVVEALDPFIARDNEWNARVIRSARVLQQELLHTLGIAPDSDRAAWRVEHPDGSREEVELESTDVETYRSWNSFPPRRLPRTPGPPYPGRRDESFWMTELPGTKALYVQYNAVAPATESGETLTGFSARLAETFVQGGFERIVVDVRENGGGNNTTFWPLIEALASEEVAPPGQRGRLFALMGRWTFSAAGNFVTALERRTGCILVGEPTGGAPNQYGDSETVVLPNRPALLVSVSTRYHEFSDPDDPRLTHEPAVRVELTSADWLAGHDLALEAALAWAP